MIPKKVLGLNMFFALPDDFEGDLNDALKEFIKYRESIGNVVKMNDDRTISNKELTRQELWEQFLMDYENGKKWSGNVSFGNVQIKELNDKLD